MFELTFRRRCRSLRCRVSRYIVLRQSPRSIGSLRQANRQSEGHVFSPPAQPAADHGVDSQQAFKRKEHAYPVGPSWSPECDGCKLDLSGSFERPCYRVGPSTGASPALSSTKASPASPALARCRSPRSPGTTAHTPIQVRAIII